MSASISIVKGRHGGADLCERCADLTQIDDSDEEFYEDSLADGRPTIRHKREGDRSFCLPHYMRRNDVSPEYPSLRESAAASCELCALLLRGLLRRNIDWHGLVTIWCGLFWGGYKYEKESGLSYMRCVVYEGSDPSTKDEGIAFIVCPIFSDNDDVRFWLRTDDTIYREPLDPENVEWIQDELWFCDNKCEHSMPQSSFLPTRLIDIGDDKDCCLRLVKTASLTEAAASPAAIKYATLSYCWGPKEDAIQQLKTTSSNLDVFCQEIPEEQLTSVVKDTIHVSRLLGIRYVWIDCLCIIQGDLEDWQRESQMMGMVFYHSYLTICPLSSRSCLEGFLSPRLPGLHIDFQSTIHDDVRGVFTLYECHNDTETRSRSPQISTPRWRDQNQSKWRKRGWTFQEEGFASRLLFFGKSMTHFACENACVSENGFVESNTGSVISGFRQLFTMALSEDRSENVKRYAHDLWRTIFSIHGREYTYDTDIFPSIAGVAKACGEVLEDTYIAGVWKRSLHIDLIWEMGRAPPGNLDIALEDICHPVSYIAPSWSWASRFKHYFEFFAPTTYTVPGTIRRNSEVDGFMHAESAPSHIRPEVTFIGYNVDLEGKNPYGRVQNACLILRGKLAPLPPLVTPLPRRNGRYNFDYFANKLGTVTFDWEVPVDEAQEVESLKILLVASCCQATSNTVLEYWANPDEDHAAIFAEKQTGIGLGDTGRSYGEDDEALTCLSCGNEARGRNGWGIALHPAHIPGAYVRVGVCRLFGGSRALDMFRDEEAEEVRII